MPLLQPPPPSNCIISLKKKVILSSSFQNETISIEEVFKLQVLYEIMGLLFCIFFSANYFATLRGIQLFVK